MNKLFAAVGIAIAVLATSATANAGDTVNDIPQKFGVCKGSRIGCAAYLAPSERTPSDIILLWCDRDFPADDALFHNCVIRGRDSIREAMMTGKRFRPATDDGR